MELQFPSIRNKVTAEEWSVRVDLAAAYRLVALFGWDDLVSTHISARVPGNGSEFLINPFGLFFEEITASSLIKVNGVGEKVMDSDFPVNPAGFTIHSAVHEARPEINCVLHTHTVHGVAVFAQEEGILPISQQSGFVLTNLAYHSYEGIALKAAEKVRLAKDLGTANQMVLRNHGLLTCGATIAEAFKYMYTLNMTCQIQLLAQAAGKNLVEIPKDILSSMGQQSKEVTKGVGAAALVWPGLLRRLKRENPGYDV
jgi:ribulose-5-phosphate 4-epimerase/fuculose-1-phosphate aldolase